MEKPVGSWGGDLVSRLPIEEKALPRHAPYEESAVSVNHRLIDSLQHPALCYIPSVTRPVRDVRLDAIEEELRERYPGLTIKVWVEGGGKRWLGHAQGEDRDAVHWRVTTTSKQKRLAPEDLASLLGVSDA